jgi:hypothetical protein
MLQSNYAVIRKIGKMRELPESTALLHDLGAIGDDGVGAAFVQRPRKSVTYAMHHPSLMRHDAGFPCHADGDCD